MMDGDNTGRAVVWPDFRAGGDTDALERTLEQIRKIRDEFEGPSVGSVFGPVPAVKAVRWEIST